MKPTIQDPRPVFHVSRFTFHDQRGYTLIELLVAMGVFVIITSIAIGGFIRGLKTSRQAASLASANSNVASALEQMMREIRTGLAFSVAGCPPGCVKFKNLPATNPASKDIQYQLDDGRILRGENGNFNQITDDNVEVSYLNFVLLEDDNYPDRITIQLGINAKELGVEEGVINLQTTVSARN